MAKYRIRICIHKGILDNAGTAVTHALNRLGWLDVTNVRLGTVIEFNLKEPDWEKAEAIAKTQTNEVMEYYELEEING